MSSAQIDSGSTPRTNRQHERDEIKQLNDRLAGYIDAVKSLKGQNVTLEAEIEALKKEINTTADRIKEVYEAELSATRSLLEETEEEKARQTTNALDLARRNEELKKRVEELRVSVDELERKLLVVTQSLNKFEGQYNSTTHECLEMSKAVKDAEREIEELKRNLERLKRELEGEIEEKKKLHEQIILLKKEITDTQHDFTQELEELKAVGIHSFSESTDYGPQYDTKLEEAIEEIREISERDCANHKMELELRHKDTIDSLEETTQRNAESISTLTAELRKLTEHSTSKNKEIKKMQDLVDHLEKQTKDKDDEIARTKQERNEEVTRYLDELRRLRENFENKISDYKELFDVKVDLDRELAAYKALLEGEEDRLRIKASPGKRRPPRDSPATKRSRSDKSPKVSSTSAGYIQIVDVDPNGRYIQINNTSDKPESVGNFKIVHTVEDSGVSNVFNFHGRSRLKGGITTTVWANSAGEEHSPPTDIVSKQILLWGTGKETTTKLHTSKGDVIATYVQRREDPLVGGQSAGQEAQ